MAHLTAVETKGAHPQSPDILKIVFAAGGGVILLGGGLYLLLANDRGPMHPPIAPNNPAADLLKPPGPASVGLSGGLGTVEVVRTPTNAPATEAAATSTPPPDPTKESTPKQEAAPDVPCSIFPEKYCSQGEVIRTKNSRGGEEVYIGFNFTEEVPIFAGMKGQASKVALAQPAAIQGNRLALRDPDLNKPDTLSFTIEGDVTGSELSLNKEQGQEIGETQDTGIRNFGYNVIVTIRRRTPNGPVPAEDIMRRLFPWAFEKPVKTLPYEGPDKPASTIMPPVFIERK